MKLSEDLKNWRAKRPDEWKMDEFTRKAEELEKQIPENGLFCKCEICQKMFPRNEEIK